MKNYTNITIENKDHSEIEIKARIPDEIISKYKDSAIKNLGKSVKIDGFRDGHIPEDILAQKIGEQAMLEEQVRMAIADIYPDIVRNEKLTVIGRPEVIITKIAPKNPVEFTLKTAVMPKVALPDYKKIASGIKLNKTADNAPEKELMEKEKRRAEIIEDIIKESKINLPKIFIESELDKILAQFKDDIARMNIKFDEYLTKIKKSENDLRTEWKLDAEKRARMQLALNEIARAENIKAPEEDIKRETDRILERYKDAKPENVRVYLETVLANEKVFQFLENQK